VLPADVSWSDNSTGVASAAEIAPRPRVENSAIEAATRALQSASSAMILVGGSIDHAAGCLLSEIGQACDARICIETFPTRVTRGAGSGEMEKLPYLAEQAIEFLAGVDTLILLGAQPPVSFFAYPGVASVLQDPSCEVVPLAEATHDINDCLSRLHSALAVNASTRLCEHQVPDAPTGELNAFTAAQAIALHLPDNAIVIDEGATSTIACFDVTRNAAPHDWLALTGGSIGFGLPCAVGAAIACPDRKVLCLEGDGSAMYTIQALWTMAREALDVTVVIFNNAKYNILELEFARTGARGGKPGPKAATMLDIGSPTMTFTDIARGMGVRASRATTAEEFNDQLAGAMNGRGPTLIEAVVPPFAL
jgi:acetolactate synthase-1/2/3 large subunit